MRAIVHVIRRDLHLALRQGADSLMVLGFFVLAVVLFPFGIGPEPHVLERISAGVVWVMALLAALLSLDRLFQGDYEDGTLDLLALAPVPLTWIILGKVAAHWLTTGLPLLAVAPLLAMLLQMKGEGMVSLMAAMALGTPVLSLIGAVGAALVLGARRGGVLLSLLVLPLYIPVLVFGVAAVEAAGMGLDGGGSLLILGALLCAAVPLCPLATAAALRQALA
ncbi:MAG: heme exporter protein B [Rhodospirillaceae bacterium]|nr:MAG: heme exporter protein B [Rhodospirillaceae bacterium]